jgi:hypothetical protein
LAHTVSLLLDNTARHFDTARQLVWKGTLWMVAWLGWILDGFGGAYFSGGHFSGLVWLDGFPNLSAASSH